MTESSSARNLTVLVEVLDRSYLWTEGLGLHPSAVESVQGMVYKAAYRVLGSARRLGLDLDDLVQEGRLGALEACSNFDPSKGASFASYAHRWIGMRIMRALWSAHQIRVPWERYQELRRAGELPSVASLTPAPGDRPWEEKLSVDPAQEPDQEDALVKLFDAIRTLKPREQELLIRHFGLGGMPEETLEAIGISWRTSRSYVGQLKRKALLHLARLLRLKGLALPERLHG